MAIDFKQIISNVRKNYPLLKHVKIDIEFKKMKKFSMFAERISKSNYKIIIDLDKCKKKREDVLK